MFEKIEFALYRLAVLGLGALASALPLKAGAAGQSSSNFGLDRIGGVFSSYNAPTSERTFPQLVAYVIGILLSVAGAIAVLFVIIGGFWYLTSGGNEEQAEKGRSTAVNALIGLAIIILSYVVVQVVADLISR